MTVSARRRARQQLSPERWTSVAIHEAGHAVIAARVDWPIRYVSLAPRATGTLAHVLPGRRKVRTSAGSDMAFYAAGLIAQDIALNCFEREFSCRGSWDDLEHVRADARTVQDAYRLGIDPEPSLSRDATVRQITHLSWAGTYRKVVANYAGILAVADALLQSRRALTIRDVRRIADAATPTELPPRAHLAETFWPPEFMPPGMWEPASPARVSFQS